MDIKSFQNSLKIYLVTSRYFVCLLAVSELCLFSTPNGYGNGDIFSDSRVEEKKKENAGKRMGLFDTPADEGQQGIFRDEKPAYKKAPKLSIFSDDKSNKEKQVKKKAGFFDDFETQPVIESTPLKPPPDPCFNAQWS